MKISKLESLTDYVVRFTGENGKEHAKKFRLESEMTAFLDKTPTAFRVDKTTLNLAWLETEAPSAATPTGETQLESPADDFTL